MYTFRHANVPQGVDMPRFCKEKRGASGQRTFSNECGSYLIWTM